MIDISNEMNRLIEDKVPSFLAFLLLTESDEESSYGICELQPKSEEKTGW